MYSRFDENNIIKGFSTACFIIMGVLFLWVLTLELLGIDAIWLSYRSFEFAIYGIFSMGLYKIIKLLSQLIGEMKFFRRHYIQKDKDKVVRILKEKARERKRKDINNG